MGSQIHPWVVSRICGKSGPSVGGESHPCQVGPIRGQGVPSVGSETHPWKNNRHSLSHDSGLEGRGAQQVDEYLVRQPSSRPPVEGGKRLTRQNFTHSYKVPYTVFPTLKEPLEVRYRVRQSSGMVGCLTLQWAHQRDTAAVWMQKGVLPSTGGQDVARGTP